MESASSPAPAPPAACPQSMVREGRSFPLPQAPARPHMQGHWGQPNELTASQSTLCPELDQLKCQAELGGDELLPSGEQAHVHASWAMRASGLSDACASMHGLHAQLPWLSAAHKPPAAIWPWLFPGDPGNLWPEERSVRSQLGGLGTTAAKTEKILFLPPAPALLIPSDTGTALSQVERAL